MFLALKHKLKVKSRPAEFSSPPVSCLLNSTSCLLLSSFFRNGRLIHPSSFILHPSPSPSPFTLPAPAPKNLFAINPARAKIYHPSVCLLPPCCR